MAFALQRPSPTKAVYNLCAYAFEAATVASLVHGSLPGRGPARPRDGRRLLRRRGRRRPGHEPARRGRHLAPRGPPRTPARWPRSSCPQRFSAPASTACALVAALLIESGPLGVVLLVIASASLRRALPGLPDASPPAPARWPSSTSSSSRARASRAVEELAARLLGRMQVLLRCSDVELIVGDRLRPRRAHRRCWVSDGGQLRRGGRPPSRPTGCCCASCRPTSRSCCPRTTSDVGLRDWLAARGTRDALVVPMPGAGSELALIVSGRLGETTSFTRTTSR